MIAVGDKIRDKELDSRKRRLLAAAEIITNKLVQKEIDTDIVGLKDSDIRRDMMAAEIKMDLVLISRDNHHNQIPKINQKQDSPKSPDYPPRDPRKTHFYFDFPYLMTPKLGLFQGLQRNSISLLFQLKQGIKHNRIIQHLNPPH